MADDGAAAASGLPPPRGGGGGGSGKQPRASLLQVQVYTRGDVSQQDLVAYQRE